MKINYSTAFADLLARVTRYCAHPRDLNLVRQAYQFAHDKHAGQQRLSGEAFITHPVATAFLLATWKMPISVVVAGLLHDVVEDTNATLSMIKRRFGSEIERLVKGVTKAKNFSKVNRQALSAHYLRRIFLGMTDDVQIIFIKFADRLHNLLTIQFLPVRKQREIAQESLDIYAPIASRLGMSWLAKHYQDICFRVLHPQDYQEIATWLRQQKLDYKQIVLDLVATVKQLIAKHDLKATVIGRVKTLYSIFQKVKLRGGTLDSIYDILAIRIIARRKADCYSILGYIHESFVPLPRRFKDYIAAPKFNFYQSIHTAVVLPGGYLLEVQIRTSKMDQIAEFGLAAHWKYKIKAVNQQPLASHKLSLIHRLQHAEQLVNTTNKQPGECQHTQMVDLVQKEILTDNIYALTPNRDVIELPAGSSVIDFAYHIHSGIGDHMSGVLVNGKIVGFSYLIESGDVVEIKTNPHQITTKPGWLNYAKTASTRRKIKKNILEQSHPPTTTSQTTVNAQLATRGRLIFNDYIQRKFGTHDQIPLNLERLPLRLQQKLWMAVGQGNLSAATLQDLLAKNQWSLLLHQHGGSFRTRAKPDHYDVVVDQQNVKIRTRMAKCCLPVFGEPIGGFVSVTKVIYVHSAQCVNFLRQQAQQIRVVNVHWNTQLARPSKYLTKMLLNISDNPGFLNKITGILIKNDIELEAAQTKKSSQFGDYSIYLTLKVKHIQQVNWLVNHFQSFANVHQVKRLSA